ncbi:MAG: pectinacetylesterase family protein [Deltaproteobacteria bacterium]|nr:pectinacetylesterase family protein [Deltaproteobacteria bacterium]
MQHLLRLSAVLGLALAACGGDSSTSTPDADLGGPPELGTPAKTWTWVPVDGTLCADGSATGIGVNPGTSADLVFYLQGGGACFNAASCASVANPNGFGATEMTAVVSDYGNSGIFDRADPANPLKDATFVFVPYCTGDVHAGANPDGFQGRKMVGWNNVAKDLDYVYAKKGGIKRVIMSGSSAGGFGALFNFAQTADKFAPLTTHLIDDSGPPLSDTYITPCLQTTMRTLWNLSASLPADCTACTEANGGGLGNAAAYLADKYPNSRLGLITSTRDGVIRSFLGFGYPDCVNGGGPIPEADYTAAINELRDTTLASKPNFKVFTKESGLHVWLVPATMSSITSGSANLDQWLTDMLDPSKPFNTVKP